ncbi:MAG: cell wall-binding repeat-containing protein, partial [Acidimicrobiia bacterium]
PVIVDRRVVAEEGEPVFFLPPTGLAPGETETVELVVGTNAGPVSIIIEQTADSAPTSITVRQVDVADADVQTRGFTLLGQAFEVDVESGAEAGENSGGTVCFPYDPDAAAAAGLADSDLVLFHFRDDGTREALATTVDSTNHRVCAHVDSFSPFAIGELDTDRLAGDNAARTAAAISKATFEPGLPVVHIVALGPDGLGAGAAAAHAGGPVLLVDRNKVSYATRAEIERLQPARVVVVGGSDVISDAVVAQLGATRVAGDDRYGTAAALSAATFDTADVVYVASGRRAADAMVASVAAAAAGAPLLLVEQNTIPDATSAEIARLDPARVVVVGGTAAVSDVVVSALGAERLAGVDRYATSVAVAKALGSSDLFVARGDNPMDAVSGTPAVAAAGAAMLLVQPDAIPTVVRDALAAATPSTITVLGGTDAVSMPVEVDLAAFLPTED